MHCEKSQRMTGIQQELDRQNHSLQEDCSHLQVYDLSSACLQHFPVNLLVYVAWLQTDSADSFDLFWLIKATGLTHPS